MISILIQIIVIIILSIIEQPYYSMRAILSGMILWIISELILAVVLTCAALPVLGACVQCVFLFVGVRDEFIHEKCFFSPHEQCEMCYCRTVYIMGTWQT